MITSIWPWPSPWCSWRFQSLLPCCYASTRCRGEWWVTREQELQEHEFLTKRWVIQCLVPWKFWRNSLEDSSPGWFFFKKKLKDLFAKSVYEIGKGMVGRGKTALHWKVSQCFQAKSLGAVWVELVADRSQWPFPIGLQTPKRHPKNKDLGAEVPNAQLGVEMF